MFGRHYDIELGGRNDEFDGYAYYNTVLIKLHFIDLNSRKWNTKLMFTKNISNMGVCVRI